MEHNRTTKPVLKEMGSPIGLRVAISNRPTVNLIYAYSRSGRTNSKSVASPSVLIVRGELRNYKISVIINHYTIGYDVGRKIVYFLLCKFYSLIHNTSKVDTLIKSGILLKYIKYVCSFAVLSHDVDSYYIIIS